MEDNRDNKEVNKETTEYKFGYSAGTMAAYVILGCACALVVGATLKILQWMLF